MHVQLFMEHSCNSLQEGDCNCYKTVHYDRNVPHFKLKTLKKICYVNCELQIKRKLCGIYNKVGNIIVF